MELVISVSIYTGSASADMPCRVILVLRVDHRARRLDPGPDHRCE